MTTEQQGALNHRYNRRDCTAPAKRRLSGSHEEAIVGFQ